MTIELIKDILKVQEIRGQKETQALVETECYLNPSKPKIEKILWTDAQVEIMSSKVIRDRLIVSGVVKFKTVYKGEETGSIYTIDANEDFKEEIEMPGITEDMSATVKTNVEHVEEEILDERKISLKALVNILGKVEEINTLEIIKGIEQKEDLQTLSETVKYKEILGRETSYAIVKETIEIDKDKPSIEEILKINIKAYENESTVVDGRIIVSGTANVRIIYFGENQISTVERDLPFSHFLDLQEAVEGAQGDLTIEVVEGGFEVLENENGEYKAIDLEIKLKVSGAAYTENEKSLIVDAYSTREKINIETKEVNLVENIKSIIHKETVYKDLTDYSIKEIYDITGYPVILDTKIVEEGVNIEGILSVHAIYLDESGDVNTLVEEVPYNFYFPVNNISTNSNVEIDLNLESIKINSYNDAYSIEGVVRHKINVNRNRILKVINEISETGELIDKKNRPSITIYIVQRDDTLWDIAKRYNTTVDEILSANENINPNNMMPGEKIIIEKKVDLDF